MNDPLADYYIWYLFLFFRGRTEYQSTLDSVVPRRHVHFERRPSHRYAQRTIKTTKVTWATPTTTVVDEETSPMSSVTLKPVGETKAILKGSSQHIDLSPATPRPATTTATPRPATTITTATIVTNPIPEVTVHQQPETADPIRHSPIGLRMSSGSSGYSATDDVDYLKWISESATRPRPSNGFIEKRIESCEESSGCSPDGVESPDTMREEVTPSPQRSSSPDSGYEHGNGKQKYFLFWEPKHESDRQQPVPILFHYLHLGGPL